MLPMVPKDLGDNFEGQLCLIHLLLWDGLVKGQSSMPDGLAKGLHTVGGLAKVLSLAYDGPEKGLYLDGLVIGLQTSEMTLVHVGCHSVVCWGCVCISELKEMCIWMFLILFDISMNILKKRTLLKI